MKRKMLVLAGLLAVAVGAAALAGPPLADRISSSPCDPPRFLLETDYMQLRADVDAYMKAAMLSDKQPYKTKDLAGFDWQAFDIAVRKPTRVKAIVLLGTGWTAFGPLNGGTYHLEATRSCEGGAWSVTSLVEDRGGVGEAPPVPG